MNPVSLIYDFLCVAIVVISTIKGAKDGFAKTAIMTLGVVAAVVAAVVISSVCTAFIYSAVIEPAVVSGITGSIGEATSVESVTEALTKAIDGLPQISRLFFDFEGVAEGLIEASGLDAQKIAEAATENIVRPVVEPIISSLIFVVSVILLIAVVSVVANGSKVVNDVPVIGSVNSFFGGTAGIVSGGVNVLIGAIIIGFVISFGIFPQYFSEEIIQNTYIFKYAYEIQKII